MSDTHLQEKRQYQKQALLALRASHGHLDPQGHEPSDEELALLLEDKLDFKRKQQILGHIDANPALFSKWLMLIEGQEDLNTANAPSPASRIQRLREWFTPTRLSLSGTALAGVMAVILLPQPANYSTRAPQLAPPPIQPPLTSPGFNTQGNRLVENGVLQGLSVAYHELPRQDQQSLGWSLPLPSVLPQSQHVQAITLGYQLLDGRQQCQQNPQYQPPATLLAAIDKLLPGLGANNDFCNGIINYTEGLISSAETLPPQ